MSIINSNLNYILSGPIWGFRICSKQFGAFCYGVSEHLSALLAPISP